MSAPAALERRSSLGWNDDKRAEGVQARDASP